MKVSIVGISGAVGTTLLKLFETHSNIELQLYGSSRSAGQVRNYQGQPLTVAEFDFEAIANTDIVFLCVSGEFSKQYARKLAQHCIVIDSSSALRYEDDVPLLMPTINAHHYQKQQLIANPNCSSAIALMALAPLEVNIGLEHVQLATYQAASGAGAPAMEELQQKVQQFSNYGDDNHSAFFHHNLAYNVIPHIDNFLDNGYTKEEMKAAWELRKILGRAELPVAATCVRVPTLRSHSLAVNVKLQREVELEQIRTLWQQMPSLNLVDEPNSKRYPMPLSSSMRYNVEVGRLRHSLIYGKSGLDFFVSGDQLLRGAALNAYEIFCLTQNKELPKSPT